MILFKTMVKYGMNIFITFLLSMGLGAGWGLGFTGQGHDFLELLIGQQ